MKTLLALLTSACLALAVLHAPSPAGATSPAGASAAGATPSATPTAQRREAPGAWKCKSDRDGMGKVCARFTAFDQRFDTDYTRTLFNKFRRKAITVRCETEKQTTWRFSVSATVEAEAGVIFAKAKASATAGVERSVTTTDRVSAEFRLGPRKWANCKRGTYVYKIRGQVKRVRCHPSQGCNTTRKSFRAQAPSRDAFFIGPGRG